MKAYAAYLFVLTLFLFVILLPVVASLRHEFNNLSTSLPNYSQP